MQLDVDFEGKDYIFKLRIRPDDNAKAIDLLINVLRTHAKAKTSIPTQSYRALMKALGDQLVLESAVKDFTGIQR